jgi:hypothetical protein
MEIKPKEGDAWQSRIISSQKAKILFVGDKKGMLKTKAGESEK